jgi:hypothetical protein
MTETTARYALEVGDRVAYNGATGSVRWLGHVIIVRWDNGAWKTYRPADMAQICFASELSYAGAKY